MGVQINGANLSPLEAKLGGRQNLQAAVVARDIESLRSRFGNCSVERIEGIYLNFLNKIYDDASHKIKADMNAIGYIYIAAKKEARELLEKEFGAISGKTEVFDTKKEEAAPSKRWPRTRAFFDKFLARGNSQTDDASLAEA